MDRNKWVILFAKRTKTGRNQLAPITDRAMEALDAVPPLPGCPYVFYDPPHEDVLESREVAMGTGA